MLFGCNMPHLGNLRLCYPTCCIEEIKKVEALLNYFRVQTTAEEHIKNIDTIEPLHKLLSI